MRASTPCYQWTVVRGAPRPTGPKLRDGSLVPLAHLGRFADAELLRGARDPGQGGVLSHIDHPELADHLDGEPRVEGLPRLHLTAVAVRAAHNEGAVSDLDAVLLAAVEHHEGLAGQKVRVGERGDDAGLQVDGAGPGLDPAELADQGAHEGAPLGRL